MNDPVVVVAATDEVLRDPAAGPHLLTGQERARLGSFGSESGRRDFIAAHLLVRLCAARLLGTGPAQVSFGQFCPGCHATDHGRPLLTDRPDIHLSTSHTAGVVAAAAGHAPVGVDVERYGRQRSAALMRRVLAPAEFALVTEHPDPRHAFLRLWTRKEALIKVGRATIDSLAAVDLSPFPLDGKNEPFRYENCWVTDLPDPGLDVVAAVAVQPPEGCDGITD